MSTPSGAPVVSAAETDTIAAQDARWNAWSAKNSAADRITQRRMRMAMTGLLIALALVTIVLAR